MHSARVRAIGTMFEAPAFGIFQYSPGIAELHSARLRAIGIMFEAPAFGIFQYSPGIAELHSARVRAIGIMFEAPAFGIFRYYQKRGFSSLPIRWPFHINPLCPIPSRVQLGDPREGINLSFWRNRARLSGPARPRLRSMSIRVHSPAFAIFHLGSPSCTRLVSGQSESCSKLPRLGSSAIIKNTAFRLCQYAGPFTSTRSVRFRAEYNSAIPGKASTFHFGVEENRARLSGAGRPCIRSNPSP